MDRESLGLLLNRSCRIGFPSAITGKTHYWLARRPAVQMKTFTSKPLRLAGSTMKNAQITLGVLGETR